MKRKRQVKRSVGNVFADLALPDAEALSIQAELTRLIYLRVRRLGLIQMRAAERLGLKQPDVSKLMGGRHTGFSTERLLRLLNALDQDVEIIVKPRPPHARGSAGIRVVAA